MRTFDYTPLYRTTVGFDSLFDMVDNVARSDWPPYNIEKTGENTYRITMAVAGFSSEEIELTQHGPELTVIGQNKSQPDERQILHRGLAIGNFRQAFKLADHVRVAKATLENGLLAVELVREVPEALKPRRIDISSARAASSLGSGPAAKVVGQDGAQGRKAA